MEGRTLDTWSDFDVTLLKLCKLQAANFIEINWLSQKLILRFCNLEKYNRGSSYWKFNSTYLSDTLYINSMKEKLYEFCCMNFFPDDSRFN